MYGLLPPELQDVDSVRAILARSYGVGIGFALLPNRERAPTSLNEETALDDICQNPSSWLQFSDEIEAERFTFTDDGQGLLRAAYQPEGGCPLIGLEVTGPEPNSTDTLNVFVMYWGMLASEYEPRPTAS
jgi:hypothetical protein